METQMEKLKSKVKNLEMLYFEALKEKQTLDDQVEELTVRLESAPKFNGLEVNGAYPNEQHDQSGMREQNQALRDENEKLLKQAQASAQVSRSTEERLAALQAMYDNNEEMRLSTIRVKEKEIQELKGRLEEVNKDLMVIGASKENLKSQVAAEVSKRLHEAVVKETEDLHQVIESSNVELRKKTEEIQRLVAEVQSLKKESSNAVLEATKKLKQDIVGKEAEIDRLRKIILNAVLNVPDGSLLNGAGPPVTSHPDHSTAVESVKHPHHQKRSDLQRDPSNCNPGKRPFNPNVQPQPKKNYPPNGQNSSNHVNQKPYNQNFNQKFKGKPPASYSGVDSRNSNSHHRQQGPSQPMKQNGKVNQSKNSFDNLKELQSRFSKKETEKPAALPSSKNSKEQDDPSQSKQQETSCSTPNSSGSNQNGGNLLCILQEASKFQGPSTTLSKVTETVEVERRPLSRSEGLFKAGGPKPPRVTPIVWPTLHSTTHDSQPGYGVNIGSGYKKIKEKQQGQQLPKNFPGPSKDKSQRQDMLPGSSRNDNICRDGRANENSSKTSSPTRRIFVVKEVTRKLNTIHPGGDASLLPTEAIPIHQVYHGSSKLSIDGNQFSVCFALTLMMQSANNWVVNNLRICFPKLQDSSMKYGNCFMCLKFLDDAPGNAREKFVKTYTFCADDQYCSNAEKWHLNCPEATFIAEESNAFKLVGGKSSPEYPPPPIEIDLFLLTQELQTDQHMTFADKRRQVLAEHIQKKQTMANESNDFKIQFKFSDSDVGDVDMLMFGVLCEYTHVFPAMLLESACNNDGPIIHVASDFNKNTLKNLLKILTCKSPVHDLQAGELCSLLEFSLKYFLADVAQGCVDSLNNIFGKD